jgi:hypothetical protein
LLYGSELIAGVLPGPNVVHDGNVPSAGVGVAVELVGDVLR